MKQMTLAAGRGFEKHARATRKAEFLERMESLMPWAEFCALIEPHYPKAGNGRPPVGLERMLRMYSVANWFNLAVTGNPPAYFPSRARSLELFPRPITDRSKKRWRDGRRGSHPSILAPNSVPTSGALVADIERAKQPDAATNLVGSRTRPVRPRPVFSGDALRESIRLCSAVKEARSTGWRRTHPSTTALLRASPVVPFPKTQYRYFSTIEGEQQC